MLARKVMIAAVLVSTLALGGCGQPAQDSGPDYADDEAMQIIADLGGHCQDGVNKETNYLILGNHLSLDDKLNIKSFFYFHSSSFFLPLLFYKSF